MSANGAPILEATGVTKRFGGLTAVRPPNCFVTFSASSASGPSRPGGSGAVSVDAMFTAPS